MPLFPFRSSSVKPKPSTNTGGGGLFSKNRNSRNDGHSRNSESTSDTRRHRRRPSPTGDELLSPERGPQMMTDGSRTRDLVSRPPPSRRGRSPSKRRSTARGSMSPSYHQGSSKDGNHGRYLEESPDGRRRPSSELVPSQYEYSSPTSAASIHLLSPISYPPDRRKHAYASPLPVASAPLISHQADRVGPPIYPAAPTTRQIASTHHKTSSSSSAADSPRPRSMAVARSRHGSRKSSGKSATSASYSSDGVDGIDGSPRQSSSMFSTYKAVKELSKHADKAKEWIEWLNNVNDAPDEIRLLSSKVRIAKDTVSQIQIGLEARPDLVEDESGQNLKMEIEEVIDGTSETLKKMSRLLSGFTAAAQHDGTALDRLEGFWQSFNYKNEGEGQIRATDNELQIHMAELTTLMANIYARALRPPKMANMTSLEPATAPITAAKLPEPTSGASTMQTNLPAKQHSDKSTRSKEGKAPSEEMAPRSVFKPSTVQADPAPDTPPVSPQSTSKNEEHDRAREMASRSNPRDIGTSDDPDNAYSYASSRQRHRTGDKPAPAHAASPIGALPPPRISIDHDRTATEVLLDAAWDGDLRAVAEALKHAPPNACDHQNLTALHFAVERDHMAVAMLLLDRGANVHSRADGGCLPLHLAARYASADTVEMLLERAGAEPNARSSDGRTALHYAARSAVDGDDERREVIRTLRDWGTDPTLTTKKGETPRDVAQKRDHWDAAATLRRAEKKWEQDHGHTDGKPAQHRLQYKITED